MALGPPAWSALRLALSRALSATHGEQSLRRHLVPMAQAELELPVRIGDFTDFFASIFHATNAGRAFRPDNPLLPNYKYVPVGLSRPRLLGARQRHGRAAAARAAQARERDGAELRSVAQSRLRARARLLHRRAEPRSAKPVPIARAGGAHLRLLPAQRLVGARHPGLGIPAARAVPGQEFRHHRLALGGDAGGAGAVPRPGVCAARRRSAAAAVSRRSGGSRPWRPRHHARGLSCERERCGEAGTAPLRLTQSSFPTIYWTVAQMVAHHASNGCNLETGDLIGSGTVSGPGEIELGKPARTHRARQRADRIAERREARLHRGRRRDHLPRLSAPRPAIRASASASAAAIVLPAQ